MGKLRVVTALCLILVLACLPSGCRKKTKAERIPAGSSAEVRGDLAVLHAGPKGTTAAAGEAAEIIAVFDRPMAPLSARPFEDRESVFKFDPPIAGRFRWMGSRTVAFLPKDRLPYATEIKVTIPSGLRSLDGYVLKADNSWTFETIRPRLVRMSPENGSTQQRLETEVLLVFNQPVDPGKAAEFIALNGAADEGRDEPVAFEIGRPAEKQLEEAGFPVFVDRAVLLKPKNRLKPGYAYALEIRAGFPGREGGLGMEKNAVLGFETFKSFAFEGLAAADGHDPQEALRFGFTNRVIYKDFLAKLKFEPPVEIPDYYSDWSHGGETLWLNLPLKAETKYAVSIAADLADEFGNVLGREAKAAFTTAPYRPSVRMTTGHGVIEAYGDLTYPLFAVNAERVRLRASRVAKDEVIPILKRDGVFWSSEDFNPYPGFYDADKSLSFKLPRNERRPVPIELREFLPPAGRGMLFLQLDWSAEDEEWSRYPKAFLQVTELGVSGKFSPDNNLIWVSELKSGLPVSGAEVEIRDDENAVRWRGRTDAEGKAETPGWKALGFRPRERWEKPRQWVFAQRGDDAVFTSSEWGTGVEPYRFDIPYDWNPEPERLAATLFSERGIYRAGETVHLKGILRGREKGAWILPSFREVACEIQDPFNNSVHKTKAALDPFGSFSFDFETREDAALGTYTLTAAVPAERAGEEETRFSETFRVEAFRPAEFEVHLRSLSESQVFGETYQAEIKANYLFGGAMPGQKATWALRLNPTSFTPSGHKGFVFGDEAEAYDFEEPSERSRLIASGDGLLDKDGKISLKVPLLADKERSSVSADLEATVQSPSRRQISNRIQTIVHRGAFYVGLRPKTSFLKKGESLPVEIIAALPGGALAADKRVSVELAKREWRSVRKAGIGGRLEWMSEVEDTAVASEEARTKAEPVTVTFRPEKSGLYVLKAASRDESKNSILTTTYVYVTGTDYVPWQRTDDDALELVADAEAYQPGEKARILVKSPYEKAKALVTIEREFILHSQVLEIQGSSSEIEIPVTAELIPNAFVSVLLLQGRTSTATAEQVEDVGKPSFKIGYLNLSVDPSARRLAIDVAADKPAFKPRDPVTVRLKVKDAAGAGASASVALAVVDVGVLSLIGYQTPDPFPAFYGEKPLSVQTSETRLHVVGQRHYGEKGEPAGGGGAEAARAMSLSEVELRGDFKSTAYWNPSVVTDANGEAAVTFKLPDNLTTFRVMAVAQTKDSKFGRGDTSLKVAKPILLLPALPRFARLGDSFQGGVLVTNHSDKAGTVVLSIDVKGLTCRDQNVKPEIALAPGESREVLWTFTAEATGSSRLGFRAMMGSASDGLDIDIPVQLPRPTETVGLYDQTETSRDDIVVIPADIHPDAGGIDVQASASALTGLRASLDYLTNYPYLCLEQRLSAILPFLVAPRIIRDFSLTALSPQDIDTLVRTQLREAYACQKDNGGFGLWPDSRFDSPYVSAYAAFAMLKAHEAGHPIDRDRLNDALGYLKNVLQAKLDSNAYPYDRRGWLTVQAFALYDLALAGRPEPAYAEKLFQERDRLSLFGRAMLLKALARGRGSTAARETLVTEFLNKVKVTGSASHFEEEDEARLSWIYSSNTRTTALILQALLESGTTNPFLPNTARWLVEKRRAGRWASTQENFFVFHALNDYYQAYEKGQPDFAAKVVLAGKTLLEETFRNASRTAQASVKLAGFPRGQELPLHAEKTGSGLFYYGIRLTYAPLGVLPPRDEGFAAYKKIESLDGKPIESAKAGQLVVVTLEIAVPKESLFVVVEDPLPAGFEAVNAGFRTESEEAARQLGAFAAEDEARSWWDGFDHVEIHDNRVLLFADSLRTGVHTYRYLARALTFGEFVAPGIKIEQMYAPDVFGRSAEQRIKVVK
jgi:hypothetical protein